MSESEQITRAEDEVKGVLEHAKKPISAAELRHELDSTTSMSLLRLAVQRLIGRGVIHYDADRRYSLEPLKQR